jgi:hypothetical protein
MSSMLTNTQTPLATVFAVEPLARLNAPYIEWPEVGKFLPLEPF